MWRDWLESDSLPNPTAVLMWLHRSLPARLSLNVLREVHFYLRGPFLADASRPRRFSIFDVGTRTWRTTIMKRKLGVHDMQQLLTISSFEVFSVGRTESVFQLNKSTLVIDLTGTVTAMADMLVEGFPGLYYNQADSTIMAFGGNYFSPRHEVQIYSFSQNRWTMFGQRMKYARCYFSPCQHLSVLYLIDCWQPRVESFSLKTLSFTVLLDYREDECSFSRSAAYDDNIYYVNDEKCSSFDLKSRKTS